MAQGGVAEQGVYGRQASVAGGDLGPTDSFEVVEEGTDPTGVKVFDL